ncbi:hypothetical protein H8959_021672 [Pygathrix nigripes]
MAAGGRRRRPLRYQSLAALVEDSQWPFLFLVSDFSYGTDEYDGEGNEEQKGPPEGSETMPYIDESPTMSPQLSARSQGGGDGVSPTPPEGLAPGVEAGKGLEMRKLVLSGFLASEEIYINQLEALLLPMKPLKATATTSQPVLTIQQIETIFYKIQDIYEIHKEFYDNLCPKVQQWDSQVTMGHLFQKLLCPISGCVPWRTPRKHQQYDCKWYIPLADLVFPSPEESEASPQVHPFPDHELEDMKMKISALKSEIQKESYLFLLSSDYERSEWREAIQKLQKKDLQAFVLSSVELQVLTGSCFKLRTVHNIPVTSNKDDDESPGLYGFLHVIVHSAKGFKQSANLYCTLEVDSFGYFVSKAKTRVFRDTAEPKWDEEFEIELEGSQSLRILCYEKCYDKTKVNKDNNEIVDKIMGKGQIQVKWGCWN